MRLSLPRFLAGNPLKHLDPSWRQALRGPLVLGLVAALVVQLVIALAAGGGRGLVPAAGDRALVDIQPDQVTAITIDGADGQVRLTRGADGWTLPALDDFPADAVKVQGLLQLVSGLRRPLPVATSAEARARFKVGDDEPEHRLTLSGAGGEPAVLIAGDSPGFRRSYVRVAGEDAIYDLPLPGHELGAAADAWIARDRLRLDADDIERVAGDGWALVRDGDGWRLEGADGEPDNDGIAGLVGQVANLSYEGVLGTEAPTDADLDHPALTLDIRLADGDARTYRISPVGGGDDAAADVEDYVLATSSSPFRFRLSRFDLQGLIDLDPAELTLSAPAGPEEQPEAAAVQPAAAAAAQPTEAAEQPAAAAEEPAAPTAASPGPGSGAAGDSTPAAGAKREPPVEPAAAPEAGLAPSPAQATPEAATAAPAGAAAGRRGEPRTTGPPASGASLPAPAETMPPASAEAVPPAGQGPPPAAATETGAVPAAAASGASGPAAGTAIPAQSDSAAGEAAGTPPEAAVAPAEEASTTTAPAAPAPPAPPRRAEPWPPRQGPPMGPPGSHPPWGPQMPPPGWRR